MVLWILLLAQVGIQTPKILSDEDGFEFTAEEARMCPVSMPTLGLSPSEVELERRKRFHSCVTNYRAQEKARKSRPRQQMRADDPFWEIFATPEEKKQRQAEQNAAKAERERRQREEIAEATALEARLGTLADQLLARPAVVRTLVSALICEQIDVRSDLLAKLAKDKKYSKIGGAVDLSFRAEIQENLAKTDDEIQRLRGTLKAAKATPLGCKDKTVVAALTCLSDEPPEECASDTDFGQALSRAATKLSAE